MDLDKWELQVREVILHKITVEAVNEYMAKEQAVDIIRGKLQQRIPYNKDDVIVLSHIKAKKD